MMLGLVALGGASSAYGRADGPDVGTKLGADLRAAASAPSMRPDLLELFPEPIRLQSIDLLTKNGQFALRVRSADGDEGVCLVHRKRIRETYSLMLSRVIPYFVGKDARFIERHVDGVFRHGFNYKYQGMALWGGVGWTELAILDLLGRRTGVPLGELFGPRIREHSGLYYAQDSREISVNETVDELSAMVASGAKALKLRLGARVASTEKSRERDRLLIPRARDVVGGDVELYVDANGSYEFDEAIRVGRMLEAHDYNWYEEPVRFDDLWASKRIADELDIPVAAGDQEHSMVRFRWQIENEAADLFQPDLLFFGGLIRSMKVAKMAEAAGREVVPHLSGYGLGSLYVLHFASVVPNAFRYQEWKGDKDGVPYIVDGTDGPLTPVDGRVRVPAGAGLGVTFDPDFLRGMTKVRAI
ncbi:MAG: mandelate racemase/muconate lactonizing enzyme family protein [Parvularculaceae bacterium]